MLNIFLMMLFYNIHVISVKVLSRHQRIFSDSKMSFCFAQPIKKNALSKYKAFFSKNVWIGCYEILFSMQTIESFGTPASTQTESHFAVKRKNRFSFSTPLRLS